MGRAKRPRKEETSLMPILRQLGEEGLPEGFSRFWYGPLKETESVTALEREGFVQASGGYLREGENKSEEKVSWVKEIFRREGEEFTEEGSWSALDNLPQLQGLYPEEYEVRVKKGDSYINYDTYSIYLIGEMVAEGSIDSGFGTKALSRINKTLENLSQSVRQEAEKIIFRQMRVRMAFPPGFPRDEKDQIQGEEMLAELGEHLAADVEHPLLAIAPGEYYCHEEESHEVDEDGDFVERILWGIDLGSHSDYFIDEGLATSREDSASQIEIAIDRASRRAKEELFPDYYRSR
jgi:hypothetical protein